MKKFLFCCLSLLAFSCDDGDLQIEVIDFNETAIQVCGTATTATNVLFKINGDEALILEIPNGLLLNEASTDTITSTIPSQSQLTYRVFSGTVSSSYFCDAIPVTDPTVLDEIEAANGQVLITTARGTEADSLKYTHTIRLKDITLERENGSRITDLTINEFGTVTTTAN